MIQRPTWLELILISLASSMPRSIATPPGWDASPSQGYPQQYVTSTCAFIHVSEERQSGVKFLV